MGRTSYSNKTEADSIKKIETSFLKKHGYFNWERSGTITWTSGWDKHESSVGVEVSLINGDGYLRIHYTQTDRDTNEKKDFDYKIPLTTTPCRYGGKRYWFICPWYKNGNYCGKRVGVLYKNGDYFACRHCYDLTYSSKKQNRRSAFFSLLNVIDKQDKAKKLEKNIKRPYYRGKPTEKQRRVDRLYGRVFRDFCIYEQSEEGKKFTQKGR
jgi:hypothetical protein